MGRRKGTLWQACAIENGMVRTTVDGQATTVVDAAVAVPSWCCLYSAREGLKLCHYVSQVPG